MVKEKEEKRTEEREKEGVGGEKTGGRECAGMENGEFELAVNSPNIPCRNTASGKETMYAAVPVR